MKTLIIYTVAVSLFNVIGLSILSRFHEAQTKTYIDEEFHVPQAQRFCAYNFSYWDPKITTPPGLYALSAAVLVPYSWIIGESEDNNCSIFRLRQLNVFASSINLLLLCLVTQQLSSKRNFWVSFVEACSLSVFPILYFFSFLYYTDVISTMLVLAMYLAYLKDLNFIAAAIGLMATCCRQTNIIWIGYVAAMKGYSTLYEVLAESTAKEKGVRKKFKKSLMAAIFKALKSPPIFFAVISKVFSYVLVGVAFVAFIIWNGSIVLGDKSAHQATIHIPQLFYFSIITAAFSPLHFLRVAPRFMKWVMCCKGIFLSLLAITLLAVHFNTLAHPYLLADNRHYTFYVWKRVFEAHKPARYLLCPIYVYCWFCILETLKPRGPYIQLIFSACVAISLVPQKLLEPRYFVLPFLFYKLQATSHRMSSALIDLVVAMIMNAITIYIYVVCPFSSSNRVHFIW